MNVIHDAASDYILRELLNRLPRLKQFYRPDSSPGAKKAEPNWLAKGDNGRISMQIIENNTALRSDITFSAGQIKIQFYSREVEVKEQPNSSIKILREVPVLGLHRGSVEQEFSVPLADPRSLQKSVQIVSDRLSKIL